MLRLKPLLARIGQSQAALGAALGLHRSIVAQWLNHEHTPGGLDAERLTDWLRAHGATEDELATWGEPLTQPLWADARALAAPAPSPEQTQPAGRAGTTQQEQTDMLGNRASLTNDAKQHWGLTRDPFIADITSSADVYLTPETRRCRELMWQAASHGDFVAIVGESGSGKTVLVQDLEDRIATQRAPITLVRPYIVDLDQRPQGGRRDTLTALDIGRRIIRVLDPTAAIRQDRQDRWAQIHDCLRAAHASGQRVVVLIEEAHSLSAPTLRHLKRYLELKQGHTPLVAIILVGQTELGDRLDRWDESIREIQQRIAVAHLRPLDAALEPYLKHKFARVGADLAAVLAPGAVDAIKAALTITPRGVRGAQAISLLYPLAVANLVARAMNLAQLTGSPQVTADHITEAAR